MVAARKSLGDQRGVITMRRLNRREYQGTLRELLGVEINVSELPADSRDRWVRYRGLESLHVEQSVRANISISVARAL